MAPRPDRDSPVPLYHQIVETLRYRIATGQLRGRDALPTLREAARRWKVNLHTVRRAYGELADAGLVVIRRPQGAFVSAGPAAKLSVNGLVVVEDRMAEFAVRYKALEAPPPVPAVVPLSDGAALRDAAGQERRIVLVPLRAGLAVPAPPGCEWEPEGDLFVLECGPRKVAPD